MKTMKKPKKENSERWLLTYSDLITLLMILFILLYAMSSVNQAKYDQLSASLSSSMGEGAGILKGSGGVLPNGGGNTPMSGGSGQTSEAAPTQQAAMTPIPTNVPEDTLKGNEDKLIDKQKMDDLENGINDIVEDMDAGKSVGTAEVERGFTITLANDAFFDSGKAELKDNMKKGLSQIAKLLNKVNNPIIIEGFTDNVPIKSSAYTSNWQLSAARAANVAEYLTEQEHVDGTRISAIGYGEYRPIAANATVQGRSKNRRVDITVLYNNVTGMEYKSK
jgi:chemotaxis protein MotB